MEIWVLIPITATFLVLFLLMRNERVRRALSCPLKHKTAEVEIVQRSENPTKAIRVASCSLLKSPRRVDCRQTCIHQAV